MERVTVPAPEHPTTSTDWLLSGLSAALITTSVAVCVWLVPDTDHALKQLKLVDATGGSEFWTTTTTLEWTSRVQGLGATIIIALAIAVAFAVPMVLRRPWRTIASWLLVVLATGALFVPVLGAVQPAWSWQAEQIRIAEEKKQKDKERKEMEEAAKPPKQEKKDWKPTIVH